MNEPETMEIYYAVLLADQRRKKNKCSGQEYFRVHLIMANQNFLPALIRKVADCTGLLYSDPFMISLFTSDTAEIFTTVGI